MFPFTPSRSRVLPIVCAAAALMSFAGGAWTQDVGAAMPPAAPARPVLAPSLGVWPEGPTGKARAGAFQTTADDYGLRVVELPLEGPPGPKRRAHHALSFRTPAVSRMLDNLGLEGADCFTRLRLPSRLRQSSAGVEFTVQAQVALNCRF
ncbi:MAG: hypothetical protein ACOZJZ_15770 [Pseudomonadota bacterium]